MKGCTLSSRKILSSREDMKENVKENLKEETEDIKLTKLSSCGGCGAKVGAGVLAMDASSTPTATMLWESWATVEQSAPTSSPNPLMYATCGFAGV